ncbi:hypothetical protein BpHYR1_016197 [Brachionus plicatilis]|uniref:Uncharacterized protein n=1 Tax=Brachionus plicatilis TaxID=10195 RepID=A0A3M7SDB4_BRAPC|nr:hypothetical protein BpHYR1_016197 [Brachionus plicatilis]
MNKENIKLEYILNNGQHGPSDDEGLSDQMWHEGESLLANDYLFTLNRNNKPKNEQRKSFRERKTKFDQKFLQAKSSSIDFNKTLFRSTDIIYLGELSIRTEVN